MTGFKPKICWFQKLCHTLCSSKGNLADPFVVGGGGSYPLTTHEEFTRDDKAVRQGNLAFIRVRLKQVAKES